MFQLSLFIESKSENETLNVLNDVIQRLNVEILSSNLIENEPYWKVDGWYKVTCNFESKKSLEFYEAESILIKISDKWSWNKGKSSAHSSVKDMDAVFCNPKIQFSTCWFEDFE